MRTTLTHLACSNCGRPYDASAPQRLCVECRRPLLARYDLELARRALSLEEARRRAPGLDCYAEVMPFHTPHIDLGEGRAPLLRASRLDGELRGAQVLVKDESVNPTGSFKARGLAAAVSRARELGLTRLALPTAGNAGLALAAYAAAAQLEALVVCPLDTPRAFVTGARLLGAEVVLHPGLIDACGGVVAERARREGWFDCSTLKEPYRVEGKKTMGFDLVRDLGRAPDVIVYPTGGGTGVVGMWKAFEEMQALGWIGPERPRMVVVQAAGCAPIVRAFAAGDEQATPWSDARTVVSGLRVPRAIGDQLVLRALRESAGAALSFSDDEMLSAAAQLAAASGVLAAPEGGACLAAGRRLAQDGWIRAGETVVLFNTGSALSYIDAWTTD